MSQPSEKTEAASSQPPLEDWADDDTYDTDNLSEDGEGSDFSFEEECGEDSGEAASSPSPAKTFVLSSDVEDMNSQLRNMSKQELIAFCKKNEIVIDNIAKMKPKAIIHELKSHGYCPSFDDVSSALLEDLKHSEKESGHHWFDKSNTVTFKFPRNTKSELYGRNVLKFATQFMHDEGFENYRVEVNFYSGDNSIIYGVTIVLSWFDWQKLHHTQEVQARLKKLGVDPSVLYDQINKSKHHHFLPTEARNQRTPYDVGIHDFFHKRCQHGLRCNRKDKCTYGHLNKNMVRNMSSGINCFIQTNEQFDIDSHGTIGKEIGEKGYIITNFENGFLPSSEMVKKTHIVKAVFANVSEDSNVTRMCVSFGTYDNICKKVEDGGYVSWDPVVPHGTFYLSYPKSYDSW